MKNLALFIWIAAGSACALFLFHIKQEVADLEDQLAVIEEQIDEDREAIRVLEAEWSYLNRPERLSRLAERYLQLEPLPPSQVVTLDRLPLRAEDEQDGAPNTLSGEATLTSGRAVQ